MQRALERLLVGRAMAGRYVLEEVLGRGGMSIVYRAVDRTLGRPVALKLIQHADDSQELRDHLRQRFRREAGSAARIPPHPNVVRIYDYGTDPELDLDFIVMELLEGQDLKTLLDSAPPSPADAVRILMEASRGIAAGHRAGIVHRDIKPGNIFLVERDGGGVRVLDFGIAKLVEADPEDDLTVLGYTSYSPAYVSPEQLSANRSLTPASDVYQLGLVGYELLAGTKPFTPEERERLRAGEPIPLPVRGNWASVPEALRGVIERALFIDPRDRFADAAQFAEHLAIAAGAGSSGTARTQNRFVVPSDQNSAVIPSESERSAPGTTPDFEPDERTLLAPTAAGAPYDLENDATMAVPVAEPIPERQVEVAPLEPVTPAVAVARPAAKVSRRRFPLFALGVVVLLGGMTAAAVLFFDRTPPIEEDPIIQELEETFRELQSEASRQLERAGEWTP